MKINKENTLIIRLTYPDSIPMPLRRSLRPCHLPIRNEGVAYGYPQIISPGVFSIDVLRLLSNARNATKIRSGVSFAIGETLGLRLF